MFEYTLRTVPRVQFALRMAVFAAVNERPNMLGTLQSLAAPAGPLIVNVSVACPLPIVIVADPAPGLFDVTTVEVPMPPGVGTSVIPVTASPAGTFWEMVTLTPTG